MLLLLLSLSRWSLHLHNTQIPQPLVPSAQIEPTAPSVQDDTDMNAHRYQGAEHTAHRIPCTTTQVLQGVMPTILNIFRTCVIIYTRGVLNFFRKRYPRRLQTQIASCSLFSKGVHCFTVAFDAESTQDIDE